MGEPIRILHVIGIMNRAGAESMIMNLYRHIDRTRVQFDFVENSFEPAAYDGEILSLGGRIFRCPHYNGLNHFSYVKWWNTFFAEHAKEYTAVHGHLGSTAAIYLKIAKRYGVYAIAHSHSSGTDYSIKAMLYRVMSYPTRYIADYFFACSQAAGIDRYGVKTTMSGSYKVLNNAVDTLQYDYNPVVREEVRHELHISDDAFVIGHVGRFASVKNHTFLIDVFDAMLKKESNLILLLVGDGELRSEIEEKVKRLQLTEHVIFTGVRSDVNRMMMAMDILAFPSLFEGLPVTLIEAQTTGLPCLISDKVPEECILIDRLMSVCPLEASAEAWGDALFHAKTNHRTSGRENILQADYDIRTTADWLSDFYCSIERKESIS